jgi:hypothetical protein
MSPDLVGSIHIHVGDEVRAADPSVLLDQIANLERGGCPGMHDSTSFSAVAVERIDVAVDVPEYSLVASDAKGAAIA